MRDEFFEAMERAGQEKRRALTRTQEAYKKLKDVPLSRLTVGDLFTIIMVSLKGYQGDWNWPDRQCKSDAEQLEEIAGRVQTH
jgi:hypothetical protein